VRDVEHSSDREVLTLAELESFDPGATARGRERRFCCPLPACADKRHDGRHRSLSLNIETRPMALSSVRRRWSAPGALDAKRAALQRSAGFITPRLRPERSGRPRRRNRSGRQHRARTTWPGRPLADDIRTRAAHRRRRGRRIPRLARDPNRSSTGVRRALSRQLAALGSGTGWQMDPAGDQSAGRVPRPQPAWGTGGHSGARNRDGRARAEGAHARGSDRTSPDALGRYPVVVVEAPIDALSLVLLGCRRWRCAERHCQVGCRVLLPSAASRSRSMPMRPATGRPRTPRARSGHSDAMLSAGARR
jgi:hypothetical protein